MSIMIQTLECIKGKHSENTSTVSSACNNTQGTLKIASLHPDIIINN